MANTPLPRARILGALAFLFVAVFIGYVAWENWLKPVSPPPAETATTGEAPDCTDVSNLPADHALIGLKDGCVEVAFRPDLAPEHVARIRTLIGETFYDGLKFHRVIPGFMAQTGDPTGTGSGGSDLPDLKAEFTDAPFERGVLGMARTADPDSANSQFFIMFAPAPHLNGQYTVFGEVVSGMEFVDNIKQGTQANNGLVTDPDTIITFRAR